MEKHLKKSVKQLKQEMLEMTQALEKIRQEKINVYGEIFLSIVENIDDAKRAEAYFKILDANATKAQKKILADDIADLKRLAGIDDKPATKIDSATPSDAENTNTASSDNSASDDKRLEVNSNTTAM